jgi:hypothetical protein
MIANYCPQSQIQNNSVYQNNLKKLAIFLARKSQKDGRGGNFLEIHIPRFPSFRTFRVKEISKKINLIEPVL